MSALHEQLLNLAINDDGLQDILQLAVLGSLTQKVIHDTNNQLTGILGYVSLAQKSSSISDNIASFLDRTMQCCESSQVINTAFLNLLDANKKRQMKFRDILDEIIQFCGKVFHPNCTVSLSSTSLIPDFCVPEYPVRQCLLNVLISAREDIALQGELSIDIAREENSLSNEPQLIIQVHSRKSVSISASSSSPLYQKQVAMLLHPLSLFLAQKYIDSCGGELIRNTQAVSPSIYWIRLPIAESDSWTRCYNSVAHSPEHPQKKLRLILLEDQPMISDFICTMLQQEGFQVQSFYNGNSLADQLTTSMVLSTDLFLLDLCVPGIEGREIGILVRKRNPSARIIFYSALRDENNIRSWFPLNENTKFLRKPFKKEELLDLIQEMMAEKE